MLKFVMPIAMLAAAYCSTAFAQVYRCPDQMSGKITYSDSPCTDGKQIVRRASDEERMMDAERAAIAQQRNQIDQDRAALRQEQAAQQQSARQYNGPSTQPVIDQDACKKAKRELSISSSLQSGSTSDKRRRMNAAIVGVNSACGTTSELIQEPAVVRVAPRRPMTCYKAGNTMVCD